jgi:hypothetical protein
MANLRWGLENALDIPAMKRYANPRLEPYHIETMTYLKSGGLEGGSSPVPADDD